MFVSFETTACSTEEKLLSIIQMSLRVDPIEWDKHQPAGLEFEVEVTHSSAGENPKIDALHIAGDTPSYHNLLNAASILIGDG